MKMNACSAGLVWVAWMALLGCSIAAEIPTPQQIGMKKRVNVIAGAKATAVVNRLHQRSVATGEDVIAEYGRGKKDLLYISDYKDRATSHEAFERMIEKMRTAKGGPFTHLRPISEYNDNVYMTIGMGFVHYIIRSGTYLLWLQTDQPFGMSLPPTLLKLYPV